MNVLWDAMAEMHEANALDILEEAYGGEHEFNAGVMACLPKSSIGVTEDGEDIYDAASTRPLSIVNTDNRLMCGAARLRWETIFNKWVSASQKGFLRGRSMLSNVLTVDHEAMRVSLQCKAGAIILFDFKAAFPSVEREFMIESLRWLGMPERQIKFIEVLYHRTMVKIRAAGGEGDWFEMTRGIRQGCPLSPIIFAVVVDVLLCKLEMIFDGRGITRAFADDTAAVIEDLFGFMPRVAKVFESMRLSRVSSSIMKKP